jgi:hypothetical protein
MTHSNAPLDLFWFLPTSDDGPYIGSEDGHRPAEFGYLRDIAVAADRLVRFADIDLGLIDRSTHRLRHFTASRAARREAAKPVREQTEETVTHVSGL